MQAGDKLYKIYEFGEYGTPTGIASCVAFDVINVDRRSDGVTRVSCSPPGRYASSSCTIYYAAGLQDPDMGFRESRFAAWREYAPHAAARLAGLEAERHTLDQRIVGAARNVARAEHATRPEEEPCNDQPPAS